MNNAMISPPSIKEFSNVQRYWNNEKAMVMAKIFPGEFYVTTVEELVVTSLGSCIAVCIRDKESGVGGMNHFMLPELQGTHPKLLKETVISETTRYGNYAMEFLINKILTNGGKRKNLEVKAFGGAQIDSGKGIVGVNNVKFVLDYLDTEALKIKSQDLGGVTPRKVMYYPKTGKVWVRKMSELDNDNLIQQEQLYLRSIRNQPVVSDIELF